MLIVYVNCVHHNVEHAQIRVIVILARKDIIYSMEYVIPIALMDIIRINFIFHACNVCQIVTYAKIKMVVINA